MSHHVVLSAASSTPQGSVSVCLEIDGAYPGPSAATSPFVTSALPVRDRAPCPGGDGPVRDRAGGGGALSVLHDLPNHIKGRAVCERWYVFNYVKTL